MPKGNSKWAPANRLAVFNKKPGWGYRFLSNEPENLRNKEAEGWIVPNKTNGFGSEFLEEKDRTNGGLKHKDLILGAMPDETIAARTEYFQAQADAAIAGVKGQFQSGLNETNRTAVAHGEVKIERRGGVQVIQ